MDIQLLLTIPASDDDLTYTVLKLILLFSVMVFGLAALIFLGQRRYRAYQQTLQEERRRFEKERCEAEKEAINETREQIALDLHDGGTYHLRLALAEIDAAMRQTTLKETHVTLLRAAVLLERHKAELRNVAHALKEKNPFQNGVQDAIREEVSHIQALGLLHIQTKLAIHHPLPLDTGQQLLIFRIFQECMSNILKHARADSVLVELICNATQLNLTLKDNGVGFDPAGRKTGNGGISHLYKRAEVLGASLRLATKPGEGTCIELVVPFSRPPDI